MKAILIAQGCGTRVEVTVGVIPVVELVLAGRSGGIIASVSLNPIEAAALGTLLSKAAEEV